ncbi:hypothetical protein ACLX1H_008474 [Fusarium chlamydosporum]
MAEIEMDLDVAKSGLDGQDDMIDFDTDMVDSNQDLQQHNDNLETVDREMQEDDDAVNHQAYEINGMMGEDVEFDLHDVEDATHSPEPVDYEVDEAPGLESQEPAVTLQLSNEGEQERDGNPGNLDETAAQGDIADDHASAHEIDYEFEDDTEPTQSHQDVTTGPNNPPAEPEEEQVSGSFTDRNSQEAVDGGAALKQDATELGEERHTSSSHGDQDEVVDPQGTATEHEVAAFDDVEAEDLDANDRARANTSEGDEEVHEEEHTASLEETTALGTAQDHVAFDEIDAAEDDGYDASEQGPNEHREDETVDLEHADHSTSDGNLDEKPKDDFPAITVQYKGDEFPMFSTTTNSFFADTSVLDQPLKELLAGLRTELENEVALDDDLVLQVDELGLEISEVRDESSFRREPADVICQATKGELMSSVTFRQILEIFDLLVKNQDPDSSRTMYTYLFTKPNTEKRYESLVESAAAGKGLDEVIHLFETPMTADTSMLETAATIDGVHEELDEFDSPVEYPDEEQSGNDHHDETEADEVHRDEEESGNDHHQDDDAEVVDEYPVHEHTNSDTSALEVQEVTSHEQDGQDDHEITTETRVEKSADASTAEELLEVVIETDAAAENQDDEQNARAESDIDPFANFELDDGADVDGNAVLEVTEETEENGIDEPETAGTQTNGTSTTTTLQEEEEAASFNIDLGEVSTEVEVTSKVDAGDNGLDEIDWRDEPEADDQGPTTPTAAGKRSRGDDDDHDAEDEQGM